MQTDFMERIRGTFRAEALDLLVELDSALLALETEPGDTALVHRVFRAIHTIKGSGATAGFSHLARFAHKIEEAFDLAREGRLDVSPELIDCGLQACDVIRLIIEEKTESVAVPGEMEVTDAFTRLLPSAENSPAEPAEESQPLAVERTAFEIVLRPHREMFYSGADPVTLLDDLRELGQAHITAHGDQVPPFDSLEPEQCYLWWEILLVTDRDQAAVQEVFVFVEDECDVRIQLREDQAGAVSLLGSVPSEAFELFVVECEDRLVGIERDALALERNPASRENLDALFRGIHSLKGNAGLLLGHVKGQALAAGHPLQLLLRVTHALESLLDPFRATGALPVPDQLIQTVLETCDVIQTLLARLSRHGADGSLSLVLLERLGIATTAQAPAAETIDGRSAAFLNTTSQCVEMIQSCLRRMENPAGPTGPVLETYLRGLQTWSAAARYQNCTELEEPLAQQLRILDSALRSGSALGSEERSSLSSAFQTARSILHRESPNDDPVAVPGEARSSSLVTPPKTPPRAAELATIRIEQNKLDRLMRVVGELLVARGAFPLLVRKLAEGADGTALLKDLKETGSSISRIAEELQASVMSIRMLPVKSVFQRFPRLVRDLARSLGKEVRLVIEGEGIELDKTILEQIADPLVHVIRNAIDHGLEPPDERRANGKDPCGQLSLRASHQSGSVVLEVSDDGRGLDPSVLKRKAVEKGLIKPAAAAAMSDEAAFQLVFLPGFTTAARLTDVSGRGVGMDVVVNNVRNLQGTVEIQSQLGRGARFLIKLPTSLMISKGILLEAGGQEYILPLGNICDMVKLPIAETCEYRGFRLAQVRGTIYSLFSLAEMLDLVPARTPELSVAIVEAGAARHGLVVDKFLTEVEVLVKPLTNGLEQCKEFQGAAIMGDGRVVLVLNALECHNLNRDAGNSRQRLEREAF